MSFITLSEIASKEIVPGFRGRFIHSQNMTVAYWDIQAGIQSPSSARQHEKIVNVIRGRLELTIEQGNANSGGRHGRIIPLTFAIPQRGSADVLSSMYFTAVKTTTG